MLSCVASFFSSMQNLAVSQLYTTNLVIILCICFFAITVGFHFLFVLFINQNTLKQATLFLHIPITECRDRQQEAITFLKELQVVNLILIL